MQVACISSSNIRHAKENSTSHRICRLIEILIEDHFNSEVDVEIISLCDCKLEPCIGCGGCFTKDECIHDTSFTEIYRKLSEVDALFIVSAHYAPIPAKLSMLLEKMEQLAFLKRFNTDTYRSPLYGKPVGIVAHGGGTEEVAKYYKGPVLDSIWNALSYPVEMDVVGIDDEQPNGITIPVKTVTKHTDSIFPVHEYDWEDIEQRLIPLVGNVLARMARKDSGLY